MPNKTIQVVNSSAYCMQIRLLELGLLAGKRHRHKKQGELKPKSAFAKSANQKCRQQMHFLPARIGRVFCFETKQKVNAFHLLYKKNGNRFQLSTDDNQTKKEIN